MSKQDSDLIWEAYSASLEEGWGKNLAMMGMGALATYGAMKHKPEEASSHKPIGKPTHSQTATSGKSSRLNFISAVAKATKHSNFKTKFNVPVDEHGKALLNLKSLNQLEKQYNQPITELDTFMAAQS